MTADIFTAWSAAFMAWYWGAMGLCGWRVWDAWVDLDWAQRFIVAGLGFSCAGWGVHQTASTWLWMIDAYSVASVTPATWAYRALATVGVLMFGGGVSFDRCGHRGWSGLIAVGLMAGGGAVLAH